jgi:signal transduction histidine kinase
MCHARERAPAGASAHGWMPGPCQVEARMPHRWRPGGDRDVHPASTRPPTRTAKPAGYVGDVLRSIAARWDTVRHESAVSQENVQPILIVVRILVLVMVLVTVPFASPHPGVGTRGIAIAVALGISTIACVIWLCARNRPGVFAAALVVMAASGGALAGLSEFGTAIAIGCMVTSSAGIRLSTETSLAITAETVAAFLIAGLVTGEAAGALIGYPGAFIGLWAFGLTRRAYLLRAEQAEQALEQARRAHAAENKAAALAERARIAREIHDVLAHSLAAVSVNLQAAEGLLGALPDDSPELAKAIECVERAGAFTREGLAEARRAILALRDGSAPESLRPLAEQLEALTQEYRADGDTAVDFRVTGEPRPVGTEAGLTAYRTAQESLTNARKHAPGQPVGLCLEFTPADMTVQVVNPLPPADAAGPLASAGAGYGLTGLRERAALGGGTLTAGPEDGQWRVRLRIATGTMQT